MQLKCAMILAFVVAFVAKKHKFTRTRRYSNSICALEYGLSLITAVNVEENRVSRTLQISKRHGYESHIIL